MSITFSNENSRYCLGSRRTRLPHEVPVADRKHQTEWRKAVRTILAATAIALTMIVTSAHATPYVNGVALHGLWENGLTQNGLWSNGVRQNGVWQNGIFQNGPVLNGRTSTAVRPDAGPQAIGSANLIAIELPR